MKTTKEIMSTISTSQLLDEANSSILKGDYYEALHLLNAFLLFDHNNSRARLKKGLCYLYTDQSDKALFMFDQVLAEEKDLAEAYYCYAEYHKLKFDFETANSYISASIAAEPENACYHWLAAEICYLKEDYDPAFSLINRAIVLNPFKEEFYYWRALILQAFDKQAVAVNDLNRALAINPQYADAFRLRSNLKMRSGETDQALNDLRQAQRFELLISAGSRRAA